MLRSLLPTALAATCLLTPAFAQERDDLREEIRKIVREEIRAALKDLGGTTTVTTKDKVAKPTTKKSAKQDGEKGTKKAADKKATAKTKAPQVLGFDDVTDKGDGPMVLRMHKADFKAAPKVLTLRCEDGKCIVEECEGGENGLFVFQGGECPALHGSEGTFTVSLQGAADCCEAKEGKECEGEECCEAAEKCCEEADGKATGMFEIKLDGASLPAHGLFESLEFNRVEPTVIKLDGLKLDGLETLKDLKIEGLDDLKLDGMKVEPMDIEVRVTTDEGSEGKAEAKAKAKAGAKKVRIVTRRPTAV